MPSRSMMAVDKSRGVLLLLGVLVTVSPPPSHRLTVSPSPHLVLPARVAQPHPHRLTGARDRDHAPDRMASAFLVAAIVTLADVGIVAEWVTRSRHTRLRSDSGRGVGRR